MKSYSAIHSRTVLATVCAIAFALSMTVVRAQADDWNKKTVLTVNRTIDVADTVLDPGQYVFRLLDASNDRHVVQIFNGDQSHIIATVLAVPAYRMSPTSSAQFTFGKFLEKRSWRCTNGITLATIQVRSFPTRSTPPI